MGALIRAYAWNNTALGAPEAWPQSLKTLSALMLGSTQPMFIIWGTERIWLHNDAMTPVMGKKHPGALGQHALDVVWSEARDALAPLFANVFAGTPVQMDDIALELDRYGKLEEAHFAFSYTPVRDESGAIGGLFGACIETTERVRTEREAKEEGKRFQQLFDQAPTFMAVLRGPDHVFEYANPGYHALVGHREVLGRSVAEALPEAAAQGYIALLDNVYRTGEAYNGRGLKYAVQITPGAPFDDRYVDFVYQPIRDARGEIDGIFVAGVDVTSREFAAVPTRRSPNWPIASAISKTLTSSPTPPPKCSDARLKSAAPVTAPSIRPPRPSTSPATGTCRAYKASPASCTFAITAATSKT